MKAIHLVNRKFSRLTVLYEIPKNERSGARKNRPQWWCKCDCGIELKVPGWNLLSGNTKSCGCLKIENSKNLCRVLGINRRKYTIDIGIARKIYRYYSDGNLSFEQFYKLSQLNCFYCNEVPSNHSNDKNYLHNRYYYNGLDRVNNNLPHTNDNVVPCCSNCNTAKNNLDIDSFYQLIINIQINRNKLVPNWSKICDMSNINIIDLTRVRAKCLKKYKDINFDINLFYFLISQNCFYCNSSPSNYKIAKNGDKIYCNGLDRVNSNFGHILSNIVPCCKYCNFAKNNRNLSEFYNWVTKICQNKNLI